MSDLYLKDTYLNKNIDLLLNSVIIEYDLKSANTSLCKEYNLLPESIIEELNKSSRKKRVVTIGKLQRKDKEFNKGLKEAFIDIRRRFFEDNNIQDADILSIKKDAIFCLREVEYTEFGFCKFVKKNQYTSYLYLNNLEFYYNSKGETLGDDGKLNIKGISDDVIEKHDGFMNSFFKILFKHLETSSKKVQFNYLRKFIDRYKNLKLEVGYYREYNQESIIRLNDSDETYDQEVFIPYEHKQDYIDIDYNFFNILLPLVKILV